MNDNEIDDEDDDDEQLNRMIYVKWFLTFYNVYVNNVEKGTIQHEDDDNSTHIFRIKIEQKPELELDFDQQAKKLNGNKPIFEIFMTMIKKFISGYVFRFETIKQYL